MPDSIAGKVAMALPEVGRVVSNMMVERWYLLEKSVQSFVLEKPNKNNDLNSMSLSF